MKYYKLEIELLSDLCVADGGVYNSSVDTDICHDKYGLPYIPAKRIKGCLRECAQELADWGKQINPGELFGDGDRESGKKKNTGKVRISNAYLIKRDEYINEIKEGTPVIYHPQNVLNCFSRTRTQTSIEEYDKDGYIMGTAKKNSLRTIRVVNKGEVFVAEIELRDDGFGDSLDACCKIFRNMGLARTRGLGEIKATLKSYEPCNTFEKKTKVYQQEDALKYTISLAEPVICKSINGGESNSLDYIEGSKIIGLLANAVDDNAELVKLLNDDELVFSNAYILHNGHRMTEIPAYVYAIKNNKTNYINRLTYDETDDKTVRQINGMKHCYAFIHDDGLLEKISVEMEERYHHSRPEDKSIGRATDVGTSKFYQISSIKEGQKFAGFIKGRPDTIKKIYEYLSKVYVCFMGYGNSSEYGKCFFDIEPITSFNTENEQECEYVITLNSPTIIYSKNAVYSINSEDLLKEILCAADLTEDAYEKIDFERTKLFIKYTDIGGYNVTWAARKPVINVFDKGTSVKLVFKDKTSLKTGSVCFIGERNQEGYGECSIESMNCVDESKWIFATNDINEPGREGKIVGKLGNKICQKIFDEYIKFESAKLVTSKLPHLINESSRSTVSNMLLMCSEMNSIEQVKNAVKDRFEKTSENKKDKHQSASKILETVEQCKDDIIAGFCSQMSIDSKEFDFADDDVKRKILESILVELKYLIRAKKGGSANE